MTDTTDNTWAPKKQRNRLGAIASVFGILFLLLMVIYLVATSGAFLNGVILPRVGTAIHARVSVTDASISPFSQVVLKNLKVQTTGTEAEPLVAASEIRLRYSLMDIVRGNIRVDEVTLSSPTIILVENPDGSSNLDPILKSLKATTGETKPEPAAKAPGAKPLQIDLKRFALTDATIRRVKDDKNGLRELAELSHVNVTLDDVKNGQTGKLGLAADIRVENASGVLHAKLSGNYTFALAANLKPSLISGGTRLDVIRAAGVLADMAALGSELDVEVTPTDIKGLTLRFKKGDARLGELHVSGPFDLEKLEGRLSIELAGIDKQLLNLASAKSGMNFGDTTINATSQIELAKAGAMITASGQLAVGKFQLTRTNQTTPQLDLRADYNVTVDRAQNAAVLRGLTLTGTQNGAPLLKAELANPMQFGWGSASHAVGDSTLTLAISRLNLADWKPFLGEIAPAGLVSANARLLSQQGGKQLTFDFDTGIEHLTVNAGSNHLTDAAITLQASGKASDLKQFDLSNYKLEVAQQNQKLVSVSGSGTYDKASETADLRVAVKAVLAPLLQSIALPDMSVAAGTVDLTAHLTQKQKVQAVNGALTLGDLTGRFGKNEIRSLGAEMDFEAELASRQIQIRRFEGRLKHGVNPAGSLDVSGTYDYGTAKADVQVTAQLALATLLQALSLPDMSVTSGTVELKSHVTQMQKTQAVTGSFVLADLTGRFGKNEVRSFGAGMDFDVGLASRKIQFRKFAGKLVQGGDTAGSFDVSGAYDSGTTNADVQVTAQLVLAALFRAVPLPGMSVSSGTVELKSHVTQMQKTQAVTGSLSLANLSGSIGTNELRNLGTAVDFDLGMTPQQIQLHKLTGKLTQEASVGGSFDVSGSYDPVKTNANLSAKLTDFNQTCLGPLLLPVLGDKKLMSVTINGNVAAQYEQQGASAVKADFQMANLVVMDPAGKLPATPLEAKMQLDVSLRKQVADVRQFQITLTPTARAANQVQVSGQVDLSQANAVQGNLALAADSLDFTRYYDLFMGVKSAAATGTAPTPTRTESTPVTAPAVANKEPDPIKLPLRNFTATATIRRLYLHEIEIADWQTTLTIDGGHVVLNPFKLVLNGAPLSTMLDLDLGVPGWKYEGALSAQAIPLAPLVNTFQPERKGIFGGTLTAQAKMAGNGITGASLQKNLAGQFDVMATNLNLSVDNIQGNIVYTRLLKTLVSTIAVIPELANNPASAATALLSKLIGPGDSNSSTNRTGGLTADLQRSPINLVTLHGTAGSGLVNVQQAVVQSPSFEAKAHDGTITLAEVLTNSPLQIPISVLLERTIAQRINMAGNTANATYAALPDFLTMKGTLGKAKADVNYVALGSAVLQGTGGKGGQVGGVLQGLGGLLSKDATATSAQTSTTQSGGKVGGLLQGLGGILNSGVPAATNAPATNNQAPVQNLLKGFLGR